jgi:hypothetical protein
MKARQKPVGLGGGDRRFDPSGSDFDPSHGCNMLGQRRTLPLRDLLDGPSGFLGTRDDPSTSFAGRKLDASLAC